ncbi:sensor histidine kinase [Nocardioides sp. LHG3406-4]|uniref:sensor histidine kinase n=1 Tax=Nocardioides sp. LHG3406-4 TaxID=2804575 RepID=UPI003CF2C9BE
MSRERPSRHGQSSPFAVSAWPLRRKVALALAVPLLLAATLGGLRVNSDLQESANSSASASQVTVLRPAVDYLTAAERAMVAAQTATETSEADLGGALIDLQNAAVGISDARDSADLTKEQRYQVDVVLDLSRALREDTQTLSPGTWIAQLRQLQSGVTQLITTIVNAQIDPEPRLELLSQTLAGRFSLAMQQALVATERTGRTGSLELFAELGVEGSAIDRLASALGDSESGISTLRTENAQRFRTIRTGGSDLGGKQAYAEYDGLVSSLLGGIDTQLADAASSARRSAEINAAITIGALLAAILLALLVSRLLLKPIRRVREGALAVAHERLPEAVARIRAGEDPGEIVAIDVTTHEEIGQLARAVDDMHRQAVLLASGEARLRAQVGEMFVTLSRRNTSLINQQLGLIEALEKDEEDPTRLESLFRLDHLAARMRRTADSLLILADAPTLSSGEERLTVGDALQAATSGVQDYQRVRIGATSSLRIDDEAAADVVHLLTELVDNALSYSPPSSSVTLASTTAAGGVTVEIVDSGLGIPADYLAQINETLHSGGDVTPETARRMGLLVVSRLAQRYGVDVSLRGNPGSGTTATVFLPAAILPDLAQGAAPRLQAAAVRQVSPPVPEKQEPAPVVAAPVSQPELDSIEARINGVTGLPRRQRGATLERPAEPAPAPAPAPAPTPTPTPTPVSASTAPSAATAPSAPVVAALAVVEAPVAAPVTEVDTPIFRSMRSAWLSAGGSDQTWSSSEVEAGWERADVVAEASTESALTPGGLPVRRPGSQLVPGGVTRPAGTTARDPEAVRARLTAHAAGVSRGRLAAATAPDPEQTEAGPA